MLINTLSQGIASNGQTNLFASSISHHTYYYFSKGAKKREGAAKGNRRPTVLAYKFNIVAPKENNLMLELSEHCFREESEKQMSY